MLDVFCCALGCVILLLLLKMREASITVEEAQSASANLVDSEKNLAETEAKRLALVFDRDDLAKKLAVARTERDALAKNLAVADELVRARENELLLARKQIDDLSKNLALVRTERDAAARKLALVEESIKTVEKDLLLTRKKIDENARVLALAKERTTNTEDELAQKKADVVELARKLASIEKDRDALLRLVREKEKLRADSTRQAMDLNDRLIVAETKLKNSEKTIDDLTARSSETVKVRTRVSELEKQIADANVAIVDLQGTKAKLADKINQLQIDSEQKFAGISMTGRNVLFLVDISGSMDRTDENTIDPNKWPIVRDTLLKVMRTLPDLQQFQVIIFSSKFNYLLGSEGTWLKCDKARPGEMEKVIDQVRKAMTAVKPVGDTNMYSAFEEAFRYRAKGLDTIYLFSDGLPTSGAGLTPYEDRTLTNETERGVILARHIRRMLKTTWNAPDPRRAKVRINSIGFFYESPDVGAFLWALSRENDGSFVGMSRP